MRIVWVGSVSNHSSRGGGPGSLRRGRGDGTFLTSRGRRRGASSEADRSAQPARLEGGRNNRSVVPKRSAFELSRAGWLRASAFRLRTGDRDARHRRARNARPDRGFLPRRAAGSPPRGPTRDVPIDPAARRWSEPDRGASGGTTLPPESASRGAERRKGAERGSRRDHLIPSQCSHDALPGAIPSKSPRRRHPSPVSARSRANP